MTNKVAYIVEKERGEYKAIGVVTTNTTDAFFLINNIRYDNLYINTRHTAQQEFDAVNMGFAKVRDAYYTREGLKHCVADLTVNGDELDGYFVEYFTDSKRLVLKKRINTGGAAKAAEQVAQVANIEKSAYIKAIVSMVDTAMLHKRGETEKQQKQDKLAELKKVFASIRENIDTLQEEINTL